MGAGSGTADYSAKTAAGPGGSSVDGQREARVYSHTAARLKNKYRCGHWLIYCSVVQGSRLTFHTGGTSALASLMLSLCSFKVLYLKLADVDTNLHYQLW